jgi:small subunit ribosomal protein S7
MSDDTTADMALKALGSGESDVFKDAPEKFEWKPYMYLPTLESLGGGSHHEPLINIPPVEDPLLHFLTSLIMKNGERAKARRIVSRTLLYIFTLTRAPPLPILREAVLLASPAVKTVSQTHGTKVVHVPTALSEKHRTHYGLAWLLAASKARVGRCLEERLAREMVDVVQRTHAARGAPGDMKHPGSLGLKLDMHRLATVNRFVFVFSCCLSSWTDMHSLQRERQNRAGSTKGDGCCSGAKHHVVVACLSVVSSRVRRVGRVRACRRFTYSYSIDIYTIVQNTSIAGRVRVTLF